MKRILIADTAESFADAVAERLAGSCEVMVCSEGSQLLASMASFHPHVLILDVMIPGIDCVSFLRNLRASGCSTRVIATLRTRILYIESQLDTLGVDYVVIKPCDVGMLAAQACQMCMQKFTNTQQYLVNTAEYILLSLGFSLGLNRFKCVREAILMWYHAGGDLVAKQLYPEVARICGGTQTRVEKAIRDAKSSAFKRGNPAVWQLYFPPGKSGAVECPTNEEFIARIAWALEQETRPYAQMKEIG